MSAGFFWQTEQMDEKQNLYEMEMECIKAFKAQNPDDFDVVFEIDGKKLYADKCKLCRYSPTFKSMLSERWTSKNAIIEIKDYSFQDFKTFLTFIYCGECFLSDANIFAMVDIAEFYGIPAFQRACDHYLSKMKVTFDNFFQLLELSNKYTMIQMKEVLKFFICKNLAAFIKSEDFLNLEKSDMKDVVAANQKALRLEEIFEAVYKWAEFRALKKQESDGNLNLNDAIKEELTDILPFFKFQEMNIEFLIKFVVKKSFLFSGDKLSDILWSARGKVYVKIFDANNKIMKGILNCPDIEKIGEVIQSQKNIIYGSDYSWKTRQAKPSAPSKIIKKSTIEWYLIYDGSGDLAVKHGRKVEDDHYILAEMYAEDGFFLTRKCKIEIYRYA
uniref:BTB domain-containing protein n=1 Tax=Panagrolaimus superbus TaxID=310955 RepID=A0A914YST6_9BILA